MLQTLLFLLSGRKGVGILALTGLLIGLVVAALEYWGGLEPCALCWTQRGILALFTLVAMIGWIAWPTSRWGRRTLLGALLISCLLGVIAASRHLYVMMVPEATSCGASIEYMIGIFPWQEVMRALLLGSASCSEVSWMLGLPIPGWSLIAFTGFAIVSIFALRAR